MLDYDGPRIYPKGKLSKGMYAGKVTKFIQWLIFQHDNGQHEDMPATILSGCQSIGVFLRVVLEGIDFFNANPKWLEWLWVQTRRSTS